MAQKGAHSERTEKPFLSDLAPAEFATMGKHFVEQFASTQTELMEKLQEMNRQWLDRIQSEAQQTTEFASKLSTAGSMPAAMTLCQEWGNQWLKMMTEDREHLLSDYQKLAETCARLWTNGARSKSSSVNT